jgi:hypothetical protein
MSLAEIKTHHVKTVLQATAIELDKLYLLTAQLQDMSALLQSANTEAAQSKALQSLDYMSQSLNALKTVLGEAAQNTPEDLVLKDLEQISEVKLNALKRSLCGDAPSLDAQDISLGDCEVFI